MTGQNVFEMNTKEATLFTTESADSQVFIDLALTSWRKDLQNDLSDFAEPSTGSDVQRRAQNLNQIEENHQVEALISNEFINHPDTEFIGFYNDEVTTKEDVEQEIDFMFKSNQLIRLSYGHIGETAGQSAVTGYLTEVTVEETAASDNSVYRITFNLLRSVPMSGSS